MSPELLQRFCATDNDPREGLHAPWTKDGKVYATNGHYAIRVDDGVVTAPVGAFNAQPDVDRLIDKHQVSTLFDLPALPPVGSDDRCQRCRGKLKLFMAPCLDCDGNGQFMHGRHEYECKECDGAGTEVCDSDSRGAKLVTCPECDGFGERTRWAGADVGAGHYQKRYLRVISQLPGVKVGVPEGDPEMVPLVFTFDGGRGLLMPMRRN